MNEEDFHLGEKSITFPFDLASQLMAGSQPYTAYYAYCTYLSRYIYYNAIE